MSPRCEEPRCPNTARRYGRCGQHGRAWLAQLQYGLPGKTVACLLCGCAFVVAAGGEERRCPECRRQVKHPKWEGLPGELIELDVARRALGRVGRARTKDKEVGKCRRHSM